MRETTAHLCSRVALFPAWAHLIRTSLEIRIMRVEKLDEPVRVRADFAGGQATPVVFRRGTQSLKIARVNARWEDRVGQKPLYYFACSVDSGDVYELCLNAHELTWRLTSVMLDG